MMHKTIKKITEDIGELRYNTAIAALMEWYNYLNSELRIKNSELTRDEIGIFLKLLAPFAPHLAEELWQRIESGIMNQELRDGSKKIHNSKFIIHNSIHLQPWPTYDPKYLEEQEATIVVEVNGKVRDTIRIQNSEVRIKNYVEQKAGESDKVKKYLDGKKIKKVVYVPGKIINFVVE